MDGAHRVPPDVADQVVMVLDELATNAMRHGAPPAAVELSATADGWLVIAYDAEPGLLPTPALDRPAEHGGMGLHMVAALTIRHGTAGDGRRKYVWALVGR